MPNKPTRPRAANGRFVTQTVADVEAVRVDYEGSELSVVEVAIRHRISASTLHRMSVRHGWTPRAPHRIDPSDLITRMFAALDAQMRDLETTMDDARNPQATMLNKLVATLDKLIEIKDAEAYRRQAPKRRSKEIIELRAKVAERLAELNEV